MSLPTKKELREVLKAAIKDGVVRESVHEGESWEHCTFCLADADLGLEPSHEKDCAFKAAQDMVLRLVDDEELERDEAYGATLEELRTKTERLVSLVCGTEMECICDLETGPHMPECEALTDIEHVLEKLKRAKT